MTGDRMVMKAMHKFKSHSTRVPRTVSCCVALEEPSTSRKKYVLHPEVDGRLQKVGEATDAAAASPVVTHTAASPAVSDGDDSASPPTNTNTNNTSFTRVAAFTVGAVAAAAVAVLLVRKWRRT